MKIKELSHYGGGCRRRLGFIWSDLAEKEGYFDATPNYHSVTLQSLQRAGTHCL